MAPKITKVTQISTNNYVKRKDHGRIKNPSVTPHPRNTSQQLPPNHHEVQGESTSMCDQHSNCILTIVNGQINPTKKDNNINSMNNKLNHIHNLLSESAVKLLNNKAKYSKCPKHNVLLMGDSHMRAHLITTERFHIHAEFTSNNHLNDNQTIFSNPIFDTLLNTHRP